MGQWEGPCPVRGAFQEAMYSRHRERLDAGGRRVIEPWYHWDAVWYAEIAQDGYFYRPGEQSSVAFLPMLPILMAAGASAGIDPYWVGLLLPNLAFAAGFACFGKVAFITTGDHATARRACALLTAYPWSFFYSAPYNESFGFALSAAALWGWCSGRAAGAAVALGFATSARMLSASLSAAVLAEWARDIVRRRPARHLAWVVAPAGLLGVLLYYGYLGRRFGDPLAQMKTQAAWGRKPASFANLLELASVIAGRLRDNPPQAIVLLALVVWIWHRPLNRLLDRISGIASRFVTVAAPVILIIATADVLFYLTLNTDLILHKDYETLIFPKFLDTTALIFFLNLGVSAWIRRGMFWGVLAITPALMACLTGSQMSMARLLMASFPAFIEAAEIFAGRSSFSAALLIMTSFQLVMIYNYTNWSFCG